ncbi:AP180 N-terminal homology (ANTH) domain [Dillenia turbinata]|uniref:AP180 N-terminal homology (ANTH) domain n=1 Tax=Dillenia turbinata TaxID=194707 RepID=A0AAN8Z015_9MAGN
MPSRLRKAIGAVKDQTSIGLAKVASNNSSNLEVAVLKATSHDEAPIDERYLAEILNLVSSDKAYAAACAQAIAKRIGRTRNWIVALKSLMLVLKIFQDGDPYFPREVLHAMKRGAKILNLSSFRDDSNPSPWDYTAFVRTVALYLDERLDCFLTGKLQRRFSFHQRGEKDGGSGRSRRHELVREMKPSMLLDKISHWQRLLDRAIATRPTGAAKNNKLVQISLYAIVRESFDLYRDISDGLALLLDSFFFHLQYTSCVNAFQTCVRASKQFEELGSFYESCKSIGIGRTSEFPSVQKISDELVETLQEFLKDQTSFPSSARQSPVRPQLLLPAPPTCRDHRSGSEYEQSEFSETRSRISERDSDVGSHRTSLEDLMTGNDIDSRSYRTSPSLSHSEEVYSASMSRISSTQSLSHSEEVYSASMSRINSAQSLSYTNSVPDLVSFDNWGEDDHNHNQEQRNPESNLPEESNDSWEIVLAETVTTKPDQTNPSLDNNLFDQTLQPEHHYNPFLQDLTEITAIPSFTDLAPYPATTSTELPEFFATPPANAQLGFPVDNFFGSSVSEPPTFQAVPTFTAEIPNGSSALPAENDPFATFSTDIVVYNAPTNQQSFLQEQELCYG